MPIESSYFSVGLIVSFITFIMNKYPKVFNAIHMLGIDFEIIYVLRAGTRQSLNNAFRFAAVELDAFAFLQKTGVNEILTVDRPERMIRRTTDRFLLAFDLKIADIARDGQLVQMARDEAQKIIDEDPECKSNKYDLLWNRLRQLRKTNINWAAIS